ncbi:MAG: hypothetical protein JWP75_717, partial [Frondihabitans sp.]|nr:hypothetical protein [Frondihabitans sp.]
ALEEGMLTAAARYLYGDAAGPTELERVRELPRQAACVRFATDLERRFAGTLVFLPAYDLVTDRPTTIGLGDSFVGGFIAALASVLEPRPREGSTK